jgi:hypothetical protein
MFGSQRRKHGVLLLCLTAVAIFAATGCSAMPKPTSGLAYLKALENSHELDTKAVKACTQGYTPKPSFLAARNSTLAFVRKLVPEPELARDTILSGAHQGYAAICIARATDRGKRVTFAEYHLTPPGDGVGSADGGGILEW